MPLFLLTDEITFPPPHLARPDGLLALGGDLSLGRLLLAYRMGIFPWYSAGEPILWWSPDPRLVLFPDELHVSRRLKRTLARGVFRVTFDHAFERVISLCAEPRAKSSGTWILSEMKEAYVRLHEGGKAHSVEVWKGEDLAGGLYGVSLGKCFFGESMFSKATDGSKIALAALVQHLKEFDFACIDCQVDSSHLRSLGAREIPRKMFLHILEDAASGDEPEGVWRLSE